MKKIYYLLLSITAIAVSAIYVFDRGVDTRKAYENYLIDEFSNIPHHDVSDMKEIPKMDRPDMAAIQDYYEIIDPKEQRVPVERLKEARKVSEQRQAMKASFSSGIEWDCLESDMGGENAFVNVGP